MSAQIIERGRGPEVAGTRVTMYRILDFLQEGSSPERIATDLELTMEQVQAALAYIAAHRSRLEQEYDEILRRVRQPNPAWVEAGRPATVEELRQRILARRSRDVRHAQPAGQF
jgi:uncharacterized protein (DUF433 family)